MRRSLVGIILPLICCCSLRSWSQSETPWSQYRISKAIDTFNLNPRRLFHDSKKASSLQYNLAEFFLYKNGKPVQPRGTSGRSFFPAACLCFKFEDTLMFNCGIGRQAGVGVGIKIFADKFSGSLHANAKNAFIYKVSKADTLYVNDLTVAAQSQSLKLLHRPSFKSKEIIVGDYWASFRRFYEKNAKGHEQTVRYAVRVVFKCKVTSIEGLKDALPSSSR